jgi:transposase
LAHEAASLRPRAGGDTVTHATKLALQVLGRRVLSLNAEVARLDEALGELVAATAPSLLKVFGVGVDTAAALLAAAGDNPERLRSEAAWAHLCGVAPIKASSGKVSRYRLNRGGNRHANAALWRIVMVRMSHDPATRAYVERRTKEGRSRLEITRMLKRYVARQIYRHLPRT